MAVANGTAVVPINSPLKRKEWLREGMVQAQSKSFTASYTGNTMDSVVYQKNDIKAGHEVDFQFDGNLVAEGVVDKETAFGTGEPKRTFSDRIVVRRFRTTVDEGDRFDGVDIGAVDLNEMGDSRRKLADKWVRFKDQAILDVMQQGATHRIVSNNFTFNDLLAMENCLKTGYGYVQMDDATKSLGRRLPLNPYRLENGDSIWLFIVDSLAKTKILSDLPTQTLLQNADIRGDGNRLIRGVLAKIGSLVIVEAQTFFGTTKGTKLTGDFVQNGYATWNRTAIQASGLRHFRVANNNTKLAPKSWSGEDLPEAANDKIFSRGVLLGAGAVQFAMGKSPDFHIQKSEDFGIKSESCLEAWVGCKATTLIPESGDYDIPLGYMSHGIVAVDMDVTSIVKP